jgi:hypothetical protein
MSAYSMFVALHVAAGTLALVAFWTTATLRKGSSRHRHAGRFYLLAMLVVIASGVPLTLQRMVDGHPVTAAFLGYLLLITSTGVWLSWRAIRDKHDLARYVGPVYRVLALVNPLAGVAVFALGVAKGAPLLIGFSVVGVFIGVDMWRRLRVMPRQPRWWIEEHYTAMLGNGVATHIAFLAIGLPRLLPGIDGTALHYAAWFAPLLVAVVAKPLLDRRWRTAPTATAAPPARRPGAADADPA